MTHQEAAALVKAMKSIYPKYYSTLSEQEVKDMVITYASIYEAYDLTAVMAGLKAYVMTDTKGFPPSPGQIIDKLDKTINRDLTPEEAWSLVRQAIRRSGYYAEEEFAKLPEVIKRAVGSPGNLASWSQLPSDEVATVIQSQFVRSYGVALKQQEEVRKIPQNVRDIIKIALNETPMLEGG